MIYCSGFTSELDTLRKHLKKDAGFQFVAIDDLNRIGDLSKARLFLLGPGLTSPLMWVRRIASEDKHLSTVVLADKAHYNRTKHLLNFSPFVGKNTTCLLFNPDFDYTEVFLHALQRTDQRRSFGKFSIAVPSKLSEVASTTARLDTLGQALEHAPVGVMLMDKRARIVGANKRSREMFAQLAQRQIALNELFSGYDASAIMEMINTGRQDVLQTERMNGAFYEISASAFREGGEAIAILLINDITERREKHKRIEATLESLPQMAWTATPEGKVSYFTSGWYNYTGQTEASALMEGWQSVVHPDDVKATLSRWNESLSKRRIYQHASRFRRFDGEYRWHLSRAVPVYDIGQEITMWVGTSTDIHAQVLLAENLELKVRERTRSLEESNAELEQFAHVSSHDLQEPLRKIHTFAHLIKDHSYASLDESSRKYIDKIIATASRMSKLLKDLLAFTKLRHSDNTERVCLRAVMESIQEDLELAIAQNNVEVRIGKLPTIVAQATQIKQLFYNLLINAIKFRRPDVDPVITIRAEKMLPDALVSYPDLMPGKVYWEVLVEDNGIGFEQKYADQIFTIFQRLHSQAEYEGTGIGLAICRRIVANHGGHIFVTSQFGEGSTFHVILPEGAL